MKRPKKHYAIYTYDVQIYDCCDRHESQHRKVGHTWAVSEAQAINNYKHRYGIRPSDLHCDSGSDAYVRDTFFEAVEIG